MATSNVAIANRALQMMGASPRISDLSQDNANARSMNVAFIPTRDALLRKHRWNFAIERASIAKDPAQTVYEGLNKYRKPNDFLDLLRDRNTTVLNCRRDWQIEGDFIVTLEGAPLTFRYIKRVEDPKLFDPLFDEAFAAKLAVNTVDDVTGSTVKRNILIEIAKEAINDAKSANAIENDSDAPPEDDWVTIMQQEGDIHTI